MLSTIFFNRNFQDIGKGTCKYDSCLCIHEKVLTPPSLLTISLRLKTGESNETERL